MAERPWGFDSPLSHQPPLACASYGWQAVRRLSTEAAKAAKVDRNKLHTRLSTQHQAPITQHFTLSHAVLALARPSRATGSLMNHRHTAPLRRFSADNSVMPTSIPMMSGLVHPSVG